MPRITLSELLALVLDAGSFAEWGGELPAVAMPDAYAAELAAARAATGRDESVVAGEARIAGRRVAVIAGDPSFLGGSIGVAAAETFYES